MLRDDVMQSIALKKRFCKDYNLPITVYDNPYFYQRLQVINEIKPCLEQFEQFCEELTTFQNEQEYFEYYNSVKDKAITDIKDNVEYNCFNQSSLECDYCCSKKNLYVEENDGKIMISLDMKKANFSAMYHWSHSIFNYCDTWEEFMAQYTNSKHIIGSKYIRQVILGACNPNKQIKYEHYLMNKLAKRIKSFCSLFRVYSLGEDEIILELPEMKIGAREISNWRKLLNDIISQSEIKNLVRITIFKLKKIKGTDGWAKFIYDDNMFEINVEFKCLNAEIFHQVVKFFLDEPIVEDDLVFYHNGNLAKLLQPIKNPWQV